MLEDQSSGAQNAGLGIDLAINHITPNDVGCEWVWIPEPECVGDVVPGMFKGGCVLVKLDHVGSSVCGLPVNSKSRVCV